jgi:hypothetical protein
MTLDRTTLIFLPLRVSQMVTIYNPLTSFVVDAVEARQMVTIYNLLTYMLCGRRGRTEIIIANVGM